MQVNIGRSVDWAVSLSVGRYQKWETRLNQSFSDQEFAIQFRRRGWEMRGGWKAKGVFREIVLKKNPIAEHKSRPKFFKKNYNSSCCFSALSSNDGGV